MTVCVATRPNDTTTSPQITQAWMQRLTHCVTQRLVSTDQASTILLIACYPDDSPESLAWRGNVTLAELAVATGCGLALGLLSAPERP